MHNENIETAGEREDDLRTAVHAADDTGLVAQQEILVHSELGDQESGALEGGVE